MMHSLPRTLQPLAGLCLTTAILSLTACSSIEVSSDYALEHDFSNYHTYAWHPGEESAPGDLDRLGGDIFDKRVRKVINETLRARGLRLHDNADCYVNYSVVTNDRVSINTYQTYGGYGPGWGYYGYGPYYGGLGGTQTSVYYYTQGTLIIDIIDRDTNQLVWRSTAQGPVETQTTPEKREQYLRKIIGRMLESFPPPAP